VKKIGLLAKDAFSLVIIFNSIRGSFAFEFAEVPVEVKMSAQYCPREARFAGEQVVSSRCSIDEHTHKKSAV
jgi:hypothetical protein